MATAPSAARICLAACRRASQQLPPRAQYLARTTQQQRIAQQQQLRALSTTIPRNARKRDEEAEDDITKEELQQKLAEIDKESMEAVSPEHRRAMDEFVQLDGYKSYSHYVQSVFEKPKTLQEDRALQDELSKDIMGERPNRNSFWYDEDDPETYTEEHEEFNEDDITSMAHGKLDEIREMRHYARLAVWEMPLLAKMAKPFAPPTDKQVLRWRYTSYMGESHPAEKKVVVQFSPEDLKLTAVQTNKLKKLVGSRYNPSTGLVKMSCDNYEYQAQNKAYLQKLVDDIITSAKDPKDTFEDIPLDTRHHNTKTKPRFPKEWRMSDARRKQLDEMRQKAALADLQRAEQGLLVDGQKAIDAYLVQKAAQEQKEALLIEASPTKGKQAPKRR